MLWPMFLRDCLFLMTNDIIQIDNRTVSIVILIVFISAKKLLSE